MGGFGKEPAVDFRQVMMPVPRTAVFQMDGYLVWCGTITRADDGLYYLLFSRWPAEYGHYAWVTHSEVACAVSDSPLGPFRFLRVVLGGRGGDHWDATTVHNPTVIRADGKYYLYYMGTRGVSTFSGKPSMEDPNWWEYRNNQRVGVAVADHPAGPWQRFDRPCLDVTPGSFDHLATNNPSVTRGPNGYFLMVYKAIADGPMPRGGGVVCGVAIARNPLGPFVKQPMPIMVNPEEGWSVEDPFIWYQDDRFLALVKDFHGYYTKHGKHTVALFSSADGVNWSVAEHPYAFGLSLMWADGERQGLLCLERPQVLIEDGRPTVLSCAAVADTDTEKAHSFIVHIPLAWPTTMDECGFVD